jgi:diguanylate cyclase (GGDEF)-like protein/PAS domain S-box-containing protein
MSGALGIAVGELLESPSAVFGTVPPTPTFNGLCAVAEHDGQRFGYLRVSGRAGGYGLAQKDSLETIARLVGWLLWARGDQSRQARQLRQQLQILEHLQESVITMDLTGFITSWNPGAEKLFGYSAAEAIGRNVLFLYADEDEDDNAFEDVFLEHGGREMEVRRRKKNGEEFWASLQLSLLRDENNQPSGLIGYLTDITERREAADGLRLHARIFELSDEAIMITDADERIVSVNPSFARITGFAAEDVMGQSQRMFRSARHDDAFYDALWRDVLHCGRWQGEVWSRRKDGEIFPMWLSIGSVHDATGKVSHFFSIFSDITERKRSEGRIHHLAFYDGLTELPNRTLFHRLLDQALIEARRHSLHGAVLFIDLNRFKPINDTLGHGVGDQVLQEVASRLRNCLRGADVVARLGGDEFVIGLFEIAHREHAGIVAQKLLDAFATPVVIDGMELAVGAAIGISVYPEDAFDTEKLLQLADIAMYRAKQNGPDAFAFYSEDMNQRATERLNLEAQLRRSIERNELLLYYQPKISLASGRIVGAEALVRWRHPERGMVPPGEFIPVAEETGLIVQISAWVLEEVCRQARQWKDAGMPVLRIAVNLSARDFSLGLPQRVSALLARHGLGPDWLDLEITEGMLMNHSDKVIAMMDEIAALDVALSLDDFGTGYSSLSYLKRFPIDTLKIDRSFVINIPSDGNDCAIAGAIISMSKQLKHQVIAEGVETLDQLEFLRTLGCDEIQGYLFSAPVTPDKFEAMVREGKTLNQQ